MFLPLSPGRPKLIVRLETPEASLLRSKTRHKGRPRPSAENTALYDIASHIKSGGDTVTSETLVDSYVPGSLRGRGDCAIRSDFYCVWSNRSADHRIPRIVERWFPPTSAGGRLEEFIRGTGIKREQGTKIITAHYAVPSRVISGSARNREESIRWSKLLVIQICRAQNLLSRAIEMHTWITIELLVEL
jgi:hypothetical protein